MDEALACGAKVMKAGSINADGVACALNASVGPCTVVNISDQNKRLSTKGYRCDCLLTKLASFPDIKWQGTPERMCKKQGKCR
jgi:hypothetical protein